jgi:hypothetical protein
MKYLAYLLVAASLLFTSCSQEDEFDSTATGQLAGEWFVTYHVESEPGSGVFDTDFGGGYYPLMTYNTNKNDKDTMYIDDEKSFWAYKAKIAVEPGTRKFGSEKEAKNLYYASKVIVRNGEVLPGMATTSGGNKSDSICFYIQFDDDEEPYGITYKVSGYKRTGFPADEH